MFRIPRRWRRWKNQQEAGQSLVEFALVLVFIIVPFTFAFIEASILLYKYVALNNAAREGARAGSIYLYVGNPGNSPAAPDAGRSAAVATTVNRAVRPLIAPPPDCTGSSAATSCQISYGPPSGPISDPLRSTDTFTVTLTHTHPFLFGALAGQISIRAQSGMRIEPSAVISGTGP